MADYLPGPDADYQARFTNFGRSFAGWKPTPPLAALGLLAADMTPVKTGQTAFNSGFSAHVPAAVPARHASRRTALR